MALLPQTAVGVGAVGIDPQDDELGKIQTITDIFKRLGSADLLKNAVLKALGGGNPKLRDLVYIDVKNWVVCPLDWGGAFPLKESKKKMCFKTASRQDMQHYGERVVTCIAQSKPAGFVRPS